jgi:hypothetical protein
MNMISQDKISKKQLWAGRIFTGLVTAALVGSAIAKIAGAGAMVDGLTHAGIPRGAILPIAALELTCLALYLVRRTKLIGMLLLTGYFGGAIVTHIIGRENFFPPLMIGIWGWAGAYLQLPALRRLLPMAADEGSKSTKPERAAPAFAKAR